MSFVVEQAEARGKPPPKWWDERPILSPLLETLLGIYYDLSTCRYFEGGRISWTAVKEYADWSGIDITYLWSLVTSLDNAYLDYRQKELEEKSKGS